MAYVSPGVYVEEVPSAAQPIAGVGTSTAGFVGVVPDAVDIPERNPDYTGPGTTAVEAIPAELTGRTLAEDIVLLDTILPAGTVLDADQAQAIKTAGLTVEVEYQQDADAALQGETLAEDITDPTAVLTFTVGTETFPLAAGHVVVAGQVGPIPTALSDAGIDARRVRVTLDASSADVTAADLEGRALVTETALPGGTLPAGTEIDAALAAQIAAAVTAAGGTTVSVEVPGPFLTSTFTLPDDAGTVKLCTHFGEFKKFFGDFSTDADQRRLAHGVYGFFNNGGTRCFVMRYAALADLQAPTALEPFEAVDEIALVAAPGISDGTVQSNLLNHCTKTDDRFAILDCEEEIDGGGLTVDTITRPDNNNYGAFYVPWIQVFDPATKTMDPDSDGRIFVGPGGHLAGIYARVDTDRGVHKAPANEAVRGALGLRYAISRSLQDGLNPDGINCIRDLNGAIRVWGARTLGGDANTEWKYVNIRRLLLFLRESIDQGTQWVVFEPNEPSLWAEIARNVTAFLTNVWRDGALFGATPQEAFYVKCDQETNPPEVRDAGQVVTEIGVAVVSPAEFVIFRISQRASPGG